MDPHLTSEPSAKYGQDSCPNAPNACYCTGACNRNTPYGPGSLRRQQHIRTPWPEPTEEQKKVAALLRDAFKEPKPSFVEQHNQQKHVAPDEANAATTDAVNPSHYKGTQTQEEMIKLHGLDAYLTFCRLSAYKYRARAGKKAGNPIEQDIAKALWYENKIEELSK